MLRPARVRSDNLFARLAQREISQKTPVAFKNECRGDKFRNYRLRAEVDTHDPESSARLHFLRRRSKIVEVVAAKDLIFGLTQTGVCAAFSRETCNRICFINVIQDEVIRSLFYNKHNDSLMTVSVYRTDNFSSLKCRTTPLENIRNGQPELAQPLFETEYLRWPGFIEFDDVNGRVLTYSADNKTYKVWRLADYSFLFSVRDPNVEDIKISPGIMLVIYTRAPNSCFVHLEILSIDDGQQLSSFDQVLHRNKKFDFIEQFNDRLLIKQEGENLQIRDIQTGNIIEVDQSRFVTPSAFIFLYENQLFLTFKGRTVLVWNFRGELVTRFDDHQLWYPDCNTNNVFITSPQDLIISYCKDGDKEAGTINVSNVFTGRCVAKIGPQCVPPGKEDAFDGITALYYNEAQNEIYTGNRLGMLHIWSN